VFELSHPVGRNKRVNKGSGADIVIGRAWQVICGRCVKQVDQRVLRYGDGKPSTHLSPLSLTKTVSARKILADAPV
jgi:hypothetical protein